jgi:hypothetical protein
LSLFFKLNWIRNSTVKLWLFFMLHNLVEM